MEPEATSAQNNTLQKQACINDQISPAIVKRMDTSKRHGRVVISLTGSNYRPRRRLEVYGHIIVNQERVTKGKIKEAWDYCREILAAIGIIAAIVFGGLTVLYQDHTNCGTVTANWNSWNSYYSYCHGLPEAARDQNCVVFLHNGLQPPPECGAFKLQVTAKADPMRTRLKRRLQRLYEQGIEEISFRLSNTVVIERISVGKYFVPNHGVVNLTSQDRLRRDCSKGWEACMRGDFWTMIAPTHYGMCLDKARESNDVPSIVIEPLNHQFGEPLSLSCGNILNHYIPEGPSFGPNKTRVELLNLEGYCTHQFRLCSAKQRNTNPRTKLEYHDWDFYHLHSITPGSTSTTVRIPKSDLIISKKPSAAGHGLKFYLGLLCVSLGVVFWRKIQWLARSSFKKVLRPDSYGSNNGPAG